MPTTYELLVRIQRGQDAQQKQLDRIEERLRDLSADLHAFDDDVMISIAALPTEEQVQQILTDLAQDEKTLAEIEQALTPAPAVRIFFIDGDGNEVLHMQIHDDKAALLQLGETDAKLNPTSLPAGVVPAFSLDDTSMGALQASDDGDASKQVFVPAGKLGRVNVSVSAGSLAAVIPIDVIAGDAVALTLSGTEIDVPAPAPAPAAPAAPSA